MMKFNDAQISILKQGLWALIANEEDWLDDDRKSVVDGARRNIGYAKMVLRSLEDYQVIRQSMEEAE
jgi:hypothetical protein